MRSRRALSNSLTERLGGKQGPFLFVAAPHSGGSRRALPGPRTRMPHKKPLFVLQCRHIRPETRNKNCIGRVPPS